MTLFLKGQLLKGVCFLAARSETGCENVTFWSEKGSGFGELTGTPPPPRPLEEFPGVPPPPGGGLNKMNLKKETS